ncbi:adenylosuccinate lyase [Neotabrizicola shimadae]|uniref:Adenylosuccinate lyase n=1 Tax=Neotabrizicola shimadae TaxID=2807096 RepID=A0A8G1EEJ6_9RHOB|nr:adenylosuccinate lyase [Neotabrizicola shimadae]QYZ71383.1 adenylosuccinate lyase [Neotabrizicola shimadae]
MKKRLTLAALALTLAPGFAFAMCSGHEVKQESASACPADQVWNAETGTCMKTTS